MTHILKHLNTDVKVIVYSHTDEHTLGKLMNKYKIEMLNTT